MSQNGTRWGLLALDAATGQDRFRYPYYPEGRDRAKNFFANPVSTERHDAVEWSGRGDSSVSCRMVPRRVVLTYVHSFAGSSPPVFCSSINQHS